MHSQLHVTRIRAQIKDPATPFDILFTHYLEKKTKYLSNLPTLRLEKRNTVDIEKVGKHLCEKCGQQLSIKDSLRRHIQILHSEQMTVFNCSICHAKDNGLEYARSQVCRYNRDRANAQFTRTLGYNVKVMSPEPSFKEKRSSIKTKPYHNEPNCTIIYRYQQSLRVLRDQ